ncbi:TlpA family protein disulfide reductase [Tenacibaculum jejuense]|uniref:Thioredoxin domain-containing protein n=1 Tax=Tenacibaculum jejuense TaxID=584609 RepID=A0A238UAE6_9FLAO|nr:thioredoxin family protein [Tenacibaculum jejuense]SNR16167.1 Protein of unknown function precursor [Tenacibaculum jejuense]
MKKIFIVTFLLFVNLVFSQAIKSENLVGKPFGNYTFETLNGDTLSINNVVKNKPRIMIVSASWCAPCQAQTLAVNELVDKYYSKVDFFTLLWDLKRDVVEMKDKYNDKITLIPSKIQEENIACISISGFKHCAGFPTIYAIDENNIIQAVKTGASMEITTTHEGKTYKVSAEEAHENNLDSLEEIILNLLKAKD